MLGPSAFGVRISSEFPLDLLPQVETEGPGITFVLERTGTLPDNHRPPDRAYGAQGRMLEITREPGHIIATVVGRMRFEIAYTANRISCLALETVDDALVSYWLLQQMLPIYLLFDGSTELLHATAIATPQGAVCFLGRSGIGKSTLLNHCLAQGDSLITDEHLALRRSNISVAVPSIPFFRPYRSLEDLGRRAPVFATSPVALRSMYLLEPADASAPVSSSALSSADTMQAVMLNQQYNLYRPEAVDLDGIVASRFSGLASLTRSVPLRRLHVPRKLERLSEVYDFMQHDLSRQYCSTNN